MIESATMGDLRNALSYCGYDLDEVMGNKTRLRLYADLRSIAWFIYCAERPATPGEASRAFGWNRSTIHCAVAKVPLLRHSDNVFSDMYDSISKAYAGFSFARKEKESLMQE